MDDPGLSIQDVEPSVKRRVGFEVPEATRELETTGFEFGTQERKDRIPPHGFEGVMVEVGVGNPPLVIEGKAPGGGGEVDMDIAFEVSPEGVNGQEDAGQEVMLSGKSFNDVGGEWRKGVKEMAIHPEEGLRVEVGQAVSR